jgi:hypothetical protein
MCKTWGRIRIRIWADKNGKSDLDRVINTIHSTDCGSINHPNTAKYRCGSIPFQMEQQIWIQTSQRNRIQICILALERWMDLAE